MTEQELEKKIRQSGVEDRESVEYFIDLAKAYADAQVEASVARQQPIFEAAMNVKNAEIKRLREFAQRARQYCEYGNGCGGATKLPSGEWFDEGEGTLYHAVLSVFSPAPLPLAGLPKLIQSGVLPPCLMLKPLDLSSLPAKYPECPLTGCYFDVESWERGKFHPIVYFRTPLDCIDLGEFDSRELAWTAIETWRNGELVKHFIPKT